MIVRSRTRRCIRRRRWVEENGGGISRDCERFAGGERAKCGTRKAERPTIVGVRGSEVVPRIDSLFHKAAPLLAPPHSVLVVELRRRATHFTSPEL